MELKKINDNEWEIPKSEGMHVPGRLFASEKILEKIKKDKTLEQIRNVAFMPGIYKYSIAMPDAHQGYGFPVGGVAAFDTKHGCISPGGIGYDINCLTEDANILTGFGFFKKIKDLEVDFLEVENKNPPYVLKSKKCQQAVVSLDKEQKLFSSRTINYFMKKKHLGPVIKIKTKLGYALEVTEEHPILTKSGMVEAGNISKDSDIAVHPFEGVMHEEIVNDIGFNFESGSQQKNELKKRDLFPLTLKNPKIPYLARLFGYLLGDGIVYFSGKKGFISAYGSEEDLKTIQHDFKQLGFSAKIYSRERDHKIKDQYGEKQFSAANFELHVSSNSLANLFYHLGYPKGIKTANAYPVPSWIMKSPLWIKRLFLSGLFGAELSSPKTHTKTGFSCPVLSLNKNKEFLEDGRKFLIQIMQLLEEFEVNVDKIHQRKEHRNKFGETYRLRLQISSEENNLLKLWSDIGFSYNKKRENLANISILYIKEKKLLTQKRSKIADKVKTFKKKGLTLKEVQSTLTCDIANKRFIERHYYENAKQRIPLDFISFEAFKEDKVKELEEYGAVFDSIGSIEKLQYDGYVYDLNIDKTHNFVANNIVVSNCGVRVMTTKLKKEQVLAKIKELLEELFRNVHCGVGSESQIRLDDKELDELLNTGLQWAKKKGYATQEDIDHCEENGCMKTADASKISQKAKSRGRRQVGTLGAGNHFLEIQYVDTIHDRETAKTFGITEENQIVVMIHSGSRGLGHQVCTDYLRRIETEFPDLVAKLPERELAYAPTESRLAQDYLKAMSAAANFGWCNRQLMTHFARESFKTVFGPDTELPLLYDVAHNIAKVENYTIEGKDREVYVHRKGATRAFGPHHKDTPKTYKEVGQPILIPGSMGTASYALVGTDKALQETFGSTPHGAGRVMSRHEANRIYKGEKVKNDLEKQHIYIKSASWKGISEEAPGVYKDIDEIVKIAHDVGIGKLVARFRPLGVLKG